MKLLYPFILALLAAIGNALVTYGQKKSSSFENPFFFGAFSLLIASVFMFLIAFLYQSKGNMAYINDNFKWFGVSAIGLVLLNVFLYLLYSHFGASYYTLYAILAIITTSIGLCVWIFHEKMNTYYWISLGFAFFTILFFMKGKSIS